MSMHHTTRHSSGLDESSVTAELPSSGNYLPIGVGDYLSSPRSWRELNASTVKQEAEWLKDMGNRVIGVG